MRVISKLELEQVLEQHPKWLETRWDDEIKGDRADLSDAYLSDADLSDANLSDADLSDANLSDADLSDANLSDADLSDANLSGANLSHADLSRADLSRADLSGANLSHADLSRADLSRADLSGANLSGANLSDANLQSIFGDLIAKCFFQPNEVAGLKALLIAGQIDGLAYAGDCACFVGSLEKLAGEQCLVPRDASSPVERWFLAIEKGDTPENNPIVKLTVEWLDSFLSAAARLSD